MSALEVVWWSETDVASGGEVAKFGGFDLYPEFILVFRQWLQLKAVDLDLGLSLVVR